MKRDDPKNGIVLRRGSYWFSRYVHGVREWHNLETTDLYEAIERKAEVLRSPKLIKTDETIAAAAVRYLAWKIAKEQHRPISGVGANTGLASFARFVGDSATLATVRSATVQRWYDEQRASYMLSTAQQYLWTVRGLFRWAVEVERVRSDNPAKAVDLIKPSQKARVRYADRATRDKLIANAPSEELRFVLYAGFHAGLRKNEISEARVFWFDLEQGLLHVQATPLPRGVKPGNKIVTDIYGAQVRPFQTKGKKDRTVPLTDKFLKFAKKFLKGRAPGEFIGNPSIPISEGFYRWWPVRQYSKFMRDQGCRWISPHVMRHTFASLLVMRGVSLYKVANWLGDTAQVAETHYAHLAPVDADIRHLD